jgi:hypothetical protein
MEAGQQASHKLLHQTTTSQWLCHVLIFGEFLVTNTQQFRKDSLHLYCLGYFL